MEPSPWNTTLGEVRLPLILTIEPLGIVKLGAVTDVGEKQVPFRHVNAGEGLGGGQALDEEGTTAL